MEERRLSEPPGRRVIPATVAGSGAILLLWSILEPIGLFLISSPQLFKLRYLVGFVSIVPACLVLLWGGRWLANSGLPTEYDSVVGWFSFIGGGGFLVFNLLLMFFFPTESVWIVTNWIRWAVSLGLVIGLVVGISYARGLSDRLSAERHSLRAEHLQKQRNLVNQMNGILRHEVLNAAQIIQGNASLLRDDDELIDPSDERIERIHRQGEELTDVIQEVRALLTTVEEDRELESVRLDDALERQVEHLRTEYPSVTVETSIPAELTIEADELLGRVFSNLLRNAAQHNDAASLRITVDAAVVDDAVVVRIGDDGGGIPDGELDTLFDRPQVGTHGMGLYLVHNLVESYGGTARLVETGPAGTTFEIEFPRSTAITRSTPGLTSADHDVPWPVFEALDD